MLIQELEHEAGLHPGGEDEAEADVVGEGDGVGAGGYKTIIMISFLPVPETGDW